MRRLRKILGWSVAVLVVSAIAAYLLLPAIREHSVPLTAIVHVINAGGVRQLSSTEHSIVVQTTDGKTLTASKEEGITALAALTELGAERDRITAIPSVDFETPSLAARLAKFVLYAIAVALITLLTVGAIGVLSIVGQEQIQKKKSQSITSGSAEELPKVSWNDIAGAEEAKRILQENSRFFKAPDLLKQVGGRLRKGVLLVGPPGTGKTMLAKAMATDIGAKFFPTSGAAFVEMYVGLGAARVRELFTKAKNESAAVIFIDEIDAIGRRRVANLAGGALEYDHALNQLLVELDGFTKQPNVMVVAATNRADVLDEALLRPGRFDLIVEVKIPSFDERYQLFAIHAVGKPLDDTWNDDVRESLARQTVGMNGAEIETIMNEAALAAAIRNSATISREDIAQAAKKIAAVVKLRRVNVGE